MSRPQSLLFAVATAVWFAVAIAPTSAHAQPRRKPPAGTPATPAPAPATPAADAKKPAGSGKPKTFDFTGIDLSGQNRSPQLLYFLERANEELERASLEKRSFMPELVRSIEEDRL
ncbi:MAG: hypothetical protein K8W52_15090 [Deltaproteobacteria bacterium]|nr:hypothetical protein [Deltaproteobacteria bacterium]